MRIIAGDLRGRHLKAVEGLQTRPTSDKVKGAVFNVLGEKVIGAKVLDLFAGTGNLALEALSRGALSATLVEKQLSAQKVIRDNLQLTGTENRARLVPGDAFLFLKQNTEEMFDIIFLDPPYKRELIAKSLAILAEPCRLTENGVIIAETSKDEKLDQVKPFEVKKTGKYGDTLVWYLQRIEV